MIKKKKYPNIKENQSEDALLKQERRKNKNKKNGRY